MQSLQGEHRSTAEGGNEGELTAQQRPELLVSQDGGLRFTRQSFSCIQQIVAARCEIANSLVTVP